MIDRTSEVVPCHLDDFGWFNAADACYYSMLDPQPPSTDAAWQGRYPEGAVYRVICVDRVPGTNGGWAWLPTPPPGYGGISVTPAQLASRAVDQMALAGPAIGITVPPERVGLVGVPVWLWTEVTPTTWGPNSATASVPGLVVTATARVTQIVWDMGDGNSVLCPTAGTPWYEGGIESPTCDHIYDQPSFEQPNGAYTITATSTWDVAWSGGGASGSLTVTRSSSTTVRIGELQVLVTN
ncbi:ATP/GTP-binding protein [Cellulomonas carbonis]|uniref:ATP/GTP-binding protein n=2 Tax=Cellulomonas carbonis TaxID=1386092 RepID=A0A0A0BVD2_9CELL|nr:ATP/GTP-binding protein [Cellulomonas carbonis]KGM11876.1 ATP/GTP-binding protein [Cellulomonas carbonis T26]